MATDAEDLECCNLTEQEYRCIAAARLQQLIELLNGEAVPTGVAEVTIRDNLPVPADFKTVTILKTNATGTVEITGDIGADISLAPQNSSIVFGDIQGKLYGAIGVASVNGGEWTWVGVK